MVCLAGNIQVAPLVVPTVAYILALFAIDHVERQRGHGAMELSKLRKKRARKIKITAIVKWIPFIGVPTIRTIHDLLPFGRMVGNGLFFARVAGAVIKRAFVSDRQASLLPTIRTERGRRHIPRGIILLVAWSNIELDFALTTRGHRD